MRLLKIVLELLKMGLNKQIFCALSIEIVNGEMDGFTQKAAEHECPNYESSFNGYTVHMSG
jgi:hypothetical protein